MLARLERELGAELDELWGQTVAGEWLRQLALTTVARAQLVAVDATGIPTALLQRALGIVEAALPLATTIVVAHHGARLSAGGRAVLVVVLLPAPAGLELEARLPAKELAGPAALAVGASGGSSGSSSSTSSSSSSAPSSDSPDPSSPGGPGDPSDPTPREEVTA